jgi:hypothetical protein
VYTVTQRIPGCDSEKTSNKYQTPKGVPSILEHPRFSQTVFRAKGHNFSDKAIFRVTIIAQSGARLSVEPPPARVDAGYAALRA